MTEPASAAPSLHEASRAGPPAPPPGRAEKVVAGIGVALVFAAAIAALRWVLAPAEPPLWAALPAGADIYFHADLAALRANPAVAWYLNDSGNGLPGGAGSRDDDGAGAANETRQFVEATGFAYQRDLHQLAAARKDGRWIGAARLSINRRRFEDYLRQRASSVRQLGAAPVYTFGGMRPLKVALLSDREMAFSIGDEDAGENGLAEAMLLIAQRTDAATAAAAIEKSLPVSAAAKWRAVMRRPLWAVSDGQELLAPQGPERPTLGGFMLGEETIAGVETILVSIESGALALGIDGELICRPGVAPKPLADNLQLLTSVMRPREPEPGALDPRPYWDALEISTEGSSVLLRWRPTAQMLGLLTAERK